MLTGVFCVSEKFILVKQLLRKETRKYLKWYMPTKEQVALYKRLKKQGRNIDKSIKKGDFHKIFQNRLVEMASLYGVMGRAEFQVITKGRLGYIDVMWTTIKGVNLLAIELDTKNNHFAIEKLLACDAKYKVWITTETNFDIEDYSYLGEIDIDVLRTEDGKEVHFIAV